MTHAGGHDKWKPHLDTLALRQTDPRLLLPNDKHVALPRRKRVVDAILDVHDVEASVVTFPVRNHTHTAHVAPTGHHGRDTRVEPDVVGDLTRREIDLDRIVDLDGRIGISNPTAAPGATRQPSSFRPFSFLHSFQADQPNLGPTTE